MPKLIICKDCGNPVSKKAKFCPQCGSPVKHRSWLKWLIIFTLSVFFLNVFFETSRYSSMPVNSPANSVTKRAEETKQRYESDLNSLEVSGVVIYKDELADNVFDKISIKQYLVQQYTESDPDIPSSFVNVKELLYKGRKIELIFARKKDHGPFHLFRIIEIDYK